jgi:hypothetical protein
MSKLLWCPIDLPKFPSRLSVKTEKNWRFWNFVNLTERLEGSAYQRTKIREDIANEYPELIEWLSLFPIKSIRNFKFNIQTSAVVTHLDFSRREDDEDLYLNNNENEPCGYRILLKGQRENCLYMSDGRHGKKIYCTMPEETDVYVLRHTDGWHGTEEDQDRQTMFLHIEVDPAKHQELLKRSLDKYGKYAVYE